jgi:amino acid transporter
MVDLLTSLNVQEVVANPQIAIVPLLVVLGTILKNKSKLPNNLIPWVITIISVALALIFVELSVKGALTGIIDAAIAVFGHGLSKIKDVTTNDVTNQEDI